jgi:hypothetical protein
LPSTEAVTEASFVNLDSGVERVIPMFIFICFSAATATAENLQTIFITRFFGGVYVPTISQVS